MSSIAAEIMSSSQPKSEFQSTMTSDRRSSVTATLKANPSSAHRANNNDNEENANSERKLSRIQMVKSNAVAKKSSSSTVAIDLKLHERKISSIIASHNAASDDLSGYRKRTSLASAVAKSSNASRENTQLRKDESDKSLLDRAVQTERDLNNQNSTNNKNIDATPGVVAPIW